MTTGSDGTPWPRDVWDKTILPDPNASPAMRAVARVYYEFAGQGDITWAAPEKLRQWTGIRKDDTVRAARDKLIAAGYLRLHEPARQHRAARYQLTVNHQPITAQTPNIRRTAPVDNSGQTPGIGGSAPPRHPENGGLTLVPDTQILESDTQILESRPPKIGCESSKESSQENSQGEQPAPRAPRRPSTRKRAPHPVPDGQQPLLGALPDPDEPPPRRCPRHLDNPTPGPCGSCGDHRRARDAWDQAHPKPTPSPPRYIPDRTPGPAPAKPETRARLHRGWRDTNPA